jgi:outer membrane receptor protein involved in Fe transport
VNLKLLQILGLFLFFTSFSTQLIYAQNGGLSGIITDEEGEGLMDVNIVLPQLNLGVVTDWEGKYYLFNIPVGKYDIYFNVIGYRADTAKQVVIENGQVQELNRILKKQGSDLMDLDIVVVGTKITGTTEAVIEEVKESKEVVTAVSAEQITKSQDRSAVDVMARIPGATVVNDRFIMVRGLAQRYNNVLLNGVLAPSTEPDSRAFSLDVIPSRLIDRLMVYKSGAANLPGDYAGASVRLYTRSVVSENFFNLGFTGGLRNGTTFQDFVKSDGSNTDWLGFDNGSRNLPSAFPKEIFRGRIFDYNQLADIAKSWPETWGSKTVTARPNLSFFFDLGKKWENGKIKVSTLTSFTYSNSNQYTKSKFYGYDEFLPDSGKSQRQYEYLDQRYVNSVSVSGISNWRFQLNSKNSIEFKNLYNQNGEDEFVLRTGIVGPIEDPRFDVRNYAFHYTERGLYSGQISGNHDLKIVKKPTDLNWVFGYSNIKRNEPDYRRARTQRKAGTEDPYQIIIPGSATTNDAARFYSNLNENTYSLGTDLVTKFAKNDSVNYELNYGIYTEYKERSFAARWFSYTKGRNFDESLVYLPLDQLFSGQNINGNTGLVVDEGTNFVDSYDANNKLGAAYLSATLPLGRFMVNAGLRVEAFNQQLNSQKSVTEQVALDSTYISPLPLFNISYELSPKSKLRLNYGKSVNRPYFRELAPFSYYDFYNNWDVIGNPNLTLANIHNVDSRIEWYPSANEFLAIGAFYKKFFNPIETVINGGSNPVFSFVNAESAYNYGIELEVRKSLRKLSTNALISNLSLLFNGALIKSEINLGNNITSQAKKRALQGQSPYTLNTGLYYSNKEDNFSVSLLYNIFGSRIAVVGNNQNNTIYELSRNSLDLTVSWTISEKVRASFGIKDVLNAKYRWYQDSNSDGKITSVDEPWRVYRRGQYLRFGFSYKL